MNDSITTEIVHVVSSVLNIMHLYEKILIEVSQQSMMELLFNINWVSLLYVHILASDAFGEYTNDTVFMVVAASASTVVKVLIPSPNRMVPQACCGIQSNQIATSVFYVICVGY